MRLVVVLLLALVAVPAAAQAADAPAPGTRVRVLFAPGVDGADAQIGILRAAGDTLVVEGADGTRLATPADAVAGLEVSAGRPPFPLWLIAAGTAAGVGVGAALAQTAPVRERCPGWSVGCGTERSGEYGLLLGLGTAAGLAASAWAALRLARERWVPVGEVSASPGGVAWRVTF